MNATRSRIPTASRRPDGLIHILYDWNRHTDAEILLAKFREEDVLAGKIVSTDAKLLLLANKATGPKPEKLYNGIELPDVWPPRFRDPASDEPMPVPYLRKPPKAIPIDLGRQLFVDDFLIEKTTLKRTFHQAKKFEGNPVFKAETDGGENARNEAVLSRPGRRVLRSRREALQDVLHRRLARTALAGDESRFENLDPARARLHGETSSCPRARPGATAKA